jgi:hypothetical protein
MDDPPRLWTASVLAILLVLVLSWIVSIVKYRLAYSKLVSPLRFKLWNIISDLCVSMDLSKRLPSACGLDPYLRQHLCSSTVQWILTQWQQ